MAVPQQEFTLFRRLPVEIQCMIWKESVAQIAPQVFEIFTTKPDAGKPTMVNLIGRNGQIDQIAVPRPENRSLDQLSFRELVLYLPKLYRPHAILQVDKTSHVEVSKTLRKIKLSNATIRMRMDVDTIYFPSHLYKRVNFQSSPFPTKLQDELLGQVQNVALGTVLFSDFCNLDCASISPFQIKRKAPRDTWGLSSLQRLKSLKRFTVVMQGMPDHEQASFCHFLEMDTVFERESPEFKATCIGCFNYVQKMWENISNEYPSWHIPTLDFLCFARECGEKPRQGRDMGTLKFLWNIQSLSPSIPSILY